MILEPFLPNKSSSPKNKDIQTESGQPMATNGSSMNGEETPVPRGNHRSTSFLRGLRFFHIQFNVTNLHYEI
jgi:hypothetical protein